MKNPYIKIVLIVIFASTLNNVIAQKNKNYALYLIENARFLCVSSNEKSVFYLEENEKGKGILVQRELLTGNIIKTFKTKFADLTIDHVKASESLVYFSTYKKIEGERLGHFDGMYSINIKTQKLQQVLILKDTINQLRDFNLVGNLLILTPYSRKGAPSIIYNLKEKTTTNLIIDKNYRIIFPIPEKNGLCILKEGNNELDDVYFCDFSQENKLTKIGAYQSSAVYSTNPEENKFPYFVINSEDSAWFYNSFNKNRYPSSIMRVADNTKLLAAYNKLDGYEFISSVYLVNNEIFIGFSSYLKKIAIYNIKTPKTVKETNLTEKQITLIDSFINNKVSYIKKAIDTTNIAPVFNARFYTITQKITDEWGNSSSEYTVVEFENKFGTINNLGGLTKFVKKDFRLKTEADALLFEKALDVIYPLGVFAEKKKEHFKKNDKWYFVRDESFDVKEAICVDINADGTILKIGKLKEIKD